jgi:hypothetical protein
MEAEYVALSQAMRDLVPIREILKEIMKVVFDCNPVFQYQTHSKAFDANSLDPNPIQNQIIPQSTVFEDNSACLKFATMPRLTPRLNILESHIIGFVQKLKTLKLLLSVLIVPINWLIALLKAVDLFKSALANALTFYRKGEL